jgi:hypothetical protein
MRDAGDGPDACLHRRRRLSTPIARVAVTGTDMSNPRCPAIRAGDNRTGAIPKAHQHRAATGLETRAGCRERCPFWTHTLN